MRRLFMRHWRSFIPISDKAMGHFNCAIPSWTKAVDSLLAIWSSQGELIRNAHAGVPTRPRTVLTFMVRLRRSL